MMLTTDKLVRLQLELECIGVDEKQCLKRIPGPNPDSIALFKVVCADGEYRSFFSADLPAAVRSSLAALSPEEAFHDEEIVRPRLEPYLVGSPNAPCLNVSRFRTYLFPDSLSPADFPDAVRLTDSHWNLIRKYDEKINPSYQTIFGLIADNRVVSTCESARENAHAGEAWVRTLPKYRGRGFARQVTAAWGCYLKQQGKVPFYSHRPDNTASRALASSLGLIPIFDGVGYE